MARPREFDQENALTKAMELFWIKGYERTSIQDLVEFTGVHRGSLYDTFGDKSQLFLACLKKFRTYAMGSTFQVLGEEGNAKELLHRFFNQLITNILHDETGRKGCLITNTAMELGAIDPVISCHVEEYSLEIETIFYTFLLQASQNEQNNSEEQLREKARFLVGIRSSLYIMGKTVTNRKILDDIVKVALTAI